MGVWGPSLTDWGGLERKSLVQEQVCVGRIIVLKAEQLRKHLMQIKLPLD